MLTPDEKELLAGSKKLLLILNADSLDEIQTSIQRLINIIPRNGLLLANGDESNLGSLININHCPVRRFGLGNECEERVDEILYDEKGSNFRVGEDEFRIPMIGELNVRNALAALLMARYTGLNNSQIQSGFDTFKGIRRRMEIRGEVNGIIVIDDFAHHPTAIRETLKALKQRFPERQIWAIFEPRSNTTRRNHFQIELADPYLKKIADRVSSLYPYLLNFYIFLLLICIFYLDLQIDKYVTFLNFL